MKEKNNYDVMSDVKCACGRFIKQNIIDRKPNTKECYACGRKRKGLVPRNQARKSPRGPYTIGSKGGNKK